MFRKNVSSLLVVASMSVAFVACGADASDVAVGVESKTPDSVAAAVTTTIATVPPNGESANVVVLDNSFRPIEVEISAGTEVVFENRGRNEHNILPDSIKNDAGLVELLKTDTSPAAWGVISVDFAPESTYSHVFSVPGTYTFYCSIHGAPGAGMYGTIVVTD